MSEINSIANGSFVLGQTSATNFVAGPGIVIDEPSAGTVRIGNDETVLWEGSLNTTAQNAALSESLANFEYVEMYAYPSTAYTGQRAAQSRKFIALSSNENTFYHIKTDNIESNVYYGEDMYVSIADTAVKLSAGCRWTGNTYTTGVSAYRGALTKIIGINRKEV